jgi:Na+/H+ antiporter NhaD/arsenite permease-like protein
MAHLSPTTVSDVQALAAYVIFLASYLVFALGKLPGLKIDRPGAAIIGAVGMVAFRIVQPDDALRFIDFPTLVLLFSMMLIVGILHLVGFFEWNAEIVLRRLKPSRLLPAVVFTSGVLSAFFVNDIVCLVMVPFVLNITRRLRLEPLPYLLAVATASNIGSVASITGNPQNMLIGSFSGIAYLRHTPSIMPMRSIFTSQSPAWIAASVHGTFCHMTEPESNRTGKPIHNQSPRFSAPFQSTTSRSTTKRPST